MEVYKSHSHHSTAGRVIRTCGFFFLFLLTSVLSLLTVAGPATFPAIESKQTDPFSHCDACFTWPVLQPHVCLLLPSSPLPCVSHTRAV